MGWMERMEGDGMGRERTKIGCAFVREAMELAVDMRAWLTDLV